MRVLGIDCGTERTGYGIIDSDGRAHRLVNAGVIRTSTKNPLETRLMQIAAELRNRISGFQPEVAAVEEVFYAVNVKTALKLSHVRGVALLAVAEAGVILAEYSPLEVKVSVVGYGRAEKHQVRRMVASLLHLDVELESEDANDALAIAICHATQAATLARITSGSRMNLFFAVLLSVPLSAPLLGADAAKIYYSKSFPGSVPAFVAITIEESGAAEYRDDPKGENPIRFQIEPASAAEIFALAQKLGKFARPLESPAKVAKMGMKTFRFEQGAEKHEVRFNYTEDPDGRLLGDWFERISETEQSLITLESAAKYDKLGVNQALLQLEAAMDRKRVVAPQQMLPMLDRIAKNESYLHIARTRAAGIADSIRAAK